MSSIQLKYIFFGTSEFSVKVLNILIKNGYTPDFVVTVPDKPQGRKMILTPPPVKIFVQAHNLKFDQPASLSSYHLPSTTYDLFVVASYGKIIPKSILDVPKYGTLNVHPSLLPKFRGSSPIQSFILSGEEKTGVTIMLMDEQVDHGQIFEQQNLEVSPPLGGETSKWLNARQLEEKLAELGGQMLIDVIPKWITSKIKAIEQDHSQATFTKKITKEDGLVDLEKDNPEIIYRKFLAFQLWPSVYFFVEKKGKKIRVIIKKARFENGKLIIEKVIPEGKKEMDYKDFLKRL